MMNKHTTINKTTKINKKEPFSFLFNIFINKNRHWEKQAQEFLSTKNYQAYGKMIQNGYVPTKKQNDYIDNLFRNIIDSKENRDENQLYYNTFETILSYGIPLSRGVVISMFFSENFSELISDAILLCKQECITLAYSPYEFDYNYELDLYGKRKELPFLTKAIKDIINHDTFSQNLYCQFKKEPIISSYVLNYKPDLLLRGVTLEEFSIVHKKLEKFSVPLSYKNLMNNIVNHYYSTEVSVIIEKTKNNYLEHVLDALTIEKINQASNQITTQDLPLLSFDIIHNIEKNYNQLKAYHINQQENNKHGLDNISSLDNLFHHAIPDILKKYLTIDKTYRTTLKNVDSKNAEELMIESLRRIETIFNDSFMYMNELNLSSLSVSNRYIESISIKNRL